MRDCDRRAFLRRAIASAALAAGGLAGLPSLLAQEGATAPTAPTKPFRIDIHHHFAPPAWISAVQGLGTSAAPLQAANANWTPAKSIADMDQGSVAAALISITNPGLWFGDEAVTIRLARQCNEYGAKLVQDYPGRFGLFAAMPLPNVDATLKEIEYAYDTLKAYGVGLFTSYGDTWLGNPAYRPVMEELNRRKAIVHVHPTAANCCRNLDYAPGITAPAMEYGTDTTRAILGITFSGDAAHFPNIRFVWSHAGGTAPFLAGRLAGSVRNLKDREQRLPNGFMYELKKFYYDVAGAANPGAMASLMKLVSSSQVLFGTDFPPAGTSVEVAKSLNEIGFSEADLRAINRDNALRLLPQLKA